MNVIGKCPTCSRSIEAGDEVLIGGVAYHEGCEPEIEVAPKQEVKKEEEMKKTKKDETIEQLAAQVAALTQTVAELLATRASAPVPAKSAHKKGTPRPDVFYVIKGYPTEKFPPQCLKVMRTLAQAAPEGGKMSEVQVWEALMGEGNKLGAWNYRQDPFHIFKYYKNPMSDGEYLRGPLSE